MNLLPTPAGAPEELRPHLLYRMEGPEAALATWRLESGQEALAIFTTANAAEGYRATLGNEPVWTIYQPPPAGLVAILETSLQAGIRIAALDPGESGARTLFDLQLVLNAARSQPSS